MRHDLRHYLQIIDGYAADGDDAAIREYVREIQTGIDETVVEQYCLSEQVNLFVSSCVVKAKKQGVPISAAADVPETLEAVRALDLCVLLANALENAAAAAATVTVSARTASQLSRKSTAARRIFPAGTGSLPCGRCSEKQKAAARENSRAAVFVT